MSRELLARDWKAGAGPGDAPFTIDLDSTICETYGLDKEGARHHGYTGARGYHPLLAVAGGTGDVLMARLREGRANTARGAAHFLRETVSRVRYGGASGQLTMRADSGFYTHAVAAVCCRSGSPPLPRRPGHNRTLFSAAACSGGRLEVWDGIFSPGRADCLAGWGGGMPRYFRCAGPSLPLVSDAFRWYRGLFSGPAGGPGFPRRRGVFTRAATSPSGVPPGLLSGRR